MVAMALTALSLGAAFGVGSSAMADGHEHAKKFSGLRARALGPAITSGRIGDFAIDPDNPSHYFVAVSSGGVWKTTNAGTTWTPVFDSQGSYSIGCLAMDPTNPKVVWVGTGENNSQRSVSFGDGVYRTRDGGKSWQNMGLKSSEHIGKIIIDPRNPDVVYVASQGPLWRSGGERGLYKTTNGGATWERILHISDDTGVNEVHFDPRDPDVMYASSYQRRRRVWTLINGGPESAIYKSTDAGATWRKITRGLPGGDKGRIGMAVSPADPDYIYAIVEASSGGGVFRSTDRGETWSRRSDYMTSSPQYYNELVADPKNRDRVYALDTFLQISDDGGADFNAIATRRRHVDDHALWINPDNTDHLLVGCDGGVYESWDRGATWLWKQNLPLTQFYRVTVDNSEPFYYVYGGTQDNNTLGGPSRTRSRAGIMNEDWFVTVGGDGFETQVDPEDPNIVYSQWQHGGLVRYDRRSGEAVDIKPRERPGEAALRWNWDSPLLISPHDNERVYFAANILFQSDDRGDSWEAISGDLTRALDRNQLEVMGRIQPVNAVSKNRSTSEYGNLVALDESILEDGLIYTGSDDGLIQVTSDGGENWRKIGLFPGVPNMAYVSDVCASRHDVDTVYAAFDDHKSGDFSPYLLRSTDRGETWESIAGNLPERDIVYTIAEDGEKADLLFVGTEFGAYFTLDGGEHWTKISGLPTIAVRDIDIQRRENDVAMATFGRGFYILDDYSPLRHATDENMTADAHIFPIKPALSYVQTSRLGGSGYGSRGSTVYSASNPPYGATFTYHVKKKAKTLKEKRLAREKADPTSYPTIEELRAEGQESPAQILLTVRDEDGDIVRRLRGSTGTGVHRTTWDLRYGAPGGGSGPPAIPGTYTVEIAHLVGDEMTTLTDPVSFDVVPLDLVTFPIDDHDEVLAWRMKVSELQRAVRTAMTVAGEAETRLGSMRSAIINTPDADVEMLAEARELSLRLDALMIRMRGDRVRSRQGQGNPPSISQRVRHASTQFGVSSPPTQTQRDAYDFAAEAFAEVLKELRTLIEDDLVELEEDLEDAGGPGKPGRLPDWKGKRP